MRYAAFLAVLIATAAIGLGQQQNGPYASLEVTGDGLNVTVLIAGLPGQPFWLFAAEGPPWYGAGQFCSASVDLAFWTGLVVAADGLTGAPDQIGMGHTAIGATLPPGLSVTIQAAVGNPNGACGIGVSQAVYVGT